MGQRMTDDSDKPDRPGFGDLETPFLVVPHGAPEPTEWMRKHPGWVKFPATSGETQFRPSCRVRPRRCV